MTLDVTCPRCTKITGVYVDLSEGPPERVEALCDKCGKVSVWGLVWSYDIELGRLIRDEIPGDGWPQGDKFWQMCPECQGEEGSFDSPEHWEDCQMCQGDGGWWVYMGEDESKVNGDKKEESREEDKLISLSAIIEALENEIEWSKGNVHLAPNQNDADWFIKGLEQAKWLILEVSKVDYQEPLAEPDASKKKSSQVNFTFGEDGNLKNMTDENHGCPGYMGDYGGIPHGPFDA